MAQQAANPVINMLPMILIFVVFYFLLIRPQRSKEKAHKKMLEGLGKNDEVITSSGIHATIVGVKEKTFIIRIDDNVKIEIEKNSVSLLKKKGVQ
ncbi:MAG: preprotein translocase subunit YajC [Candidatus Omnitrophica bacterium]|nr:preprotein translocase subunit YajC [Candidatus Omnitrophota bacterium]